MPSTLDIQKTFDEIRNQYKAESEAAKKGHSFLIYGDFGTCKTGVVATTCPRPVYIHSFDPGGTKMRRIQELIDSGDVLVERFEDEDPSHPTEFRRWVNRWAQLEKSDIFNHVGTFCLDSLTMWGECILNALAGGIKENTIIDPGKYGQQQNIMRTYIRKMMSLPCNVVVVAHKDYTKDEVLGTVRTHLATTGKSQFKIPALFEEIYVTDAKMQLVKQENGEKIEQLVPTFTTKPKGGAQARTKMGDRIFDTVEPADFTALMKKAGVL